MYYSELFLHSAQLSVSTEHPYYCYVRRWSHVRSRANLLLAKVANERMYFPYR